MRLAAAATLVVIALAMAMATTANPAEADDRSAGPAQAGTVFMSAAIWARPLGLDFKVLPSVSLGAEGLFYDFANEEAHLTTAGAPFLLHDHPDMTVVRGRVTYYFNTGY